MHDLIHSGVVQVVIGMIQQVREINQYPDWGLDKPPLPTLSDEILINF